VPPPGGAGAFMTAIRGRSRVAARPPGLV